MVLLAFLSFVVLVLASFVVTLMPVAGENAEADS